MLSFFRNRQNCKVAVQFLECLYLSLKDILPEVYENSTHWKVHTLIIKEDQLDFGNISYDSSYVERNKRRHNKHYNLKNIQVFSNQTKDYILFKAKVEFNLIKSIELKTNQLNKTIDGEKIDISRMLVEEIIYENKEHLIEIDDTFEIKLADKIFHTILDMEDGNYIAVNKKGQVFRLHHDNEQQAKKIYNSFDEFVNSYSGHKGDLQNLFE